MIRSKVAILVALIVVPAAALAGSMDIYFAPNGGFSPMNKDRILKMPDGTEVPATLENSLRQMIAETEEFGQMKICMYAVSDMSTVDLLVRAARDRRIKVKLLLDGIAEWTFDLRRKLMDKVKAARAECEARGLRFDFEVKTVEEKHMIHRRRIRRLVDGKLIFGTMHEKFGVFYRNNVDVPFDSFSGSANISYGSDQVFAENRFYFRDSPTIARQLQEEFARLWNEYADCADGECSSEKFVPADPVPGDVELIFNGEPRDEVEFHRIDHALSRLIEKVSWKETGSLDLAMFSITHRELARAVMDQAADKPKAKFRIMLDQSMLMGTETHKGVLGPWFEDQIQSRGLQNVEVRYKWRSTAYGYDEEEKLVQLIHFRSLLLHHKLLIVNRNLLAAGSYNWSSSAEERNLENVMVFNREYTSHGDIIDRFQAEYDTIWNAKKPEGPVPAPIRKVPQTVSGPQGRAMAETIIALLQDEKNLKMVQALYTEGPGESPTLESFRTAEQLGQAAGGISGPELAERIQKLVDATLLCRILHEGAELYSLAD